MSMSNSLPQYHAYFPGTRLELQSPVRQDWWDLRDGRLRYLFWRISQELEPNTDTAGHRRSASISRCPHTPNCVAGHRPLRRAPSSTAPVPNGPCIAEECPTNFGPICYATWHFIPRVWECDLLFYEMPRHSQRCRNARTLLKWRQKWSGIAASIFWQGYVNDLKERFEFPFCFRQLWQMP